MINEILDRFMSITNTDALTDVAKILNISIHTIYNWKKTGKVSVEPFLNFCKDSNISLDWLIYGRGLKYNSLAELERQALKHNNEREVVYIPYYEDIKLSAGYGATNGDYAPSEMICLPKDFIACPQKTEGVKVIGDSMTPTIMEGSIVYIDRSEIDYVKNNAIYAIRIDNEVFIKRLFIVPVGILVKSDNKDYPEFTVKKEDLNIIGIVKGVTQKL